VGKRKETNKGELYYSYSQEKGGKYWQAITPRNKKKSHPGGRGMKPAIRGEDRQETFFQWQRNERGTPTEEKSMTRIIIPQRPSIVTEVKIKGFRRKKKKKRPKTPH